MWITINKENLFYKKMYKTIMLVIQTFTNVNKPPNRLRSNPKSENLIHHIL